MNNTTSGETQLLEKTSKMQKVQVEHNLVLVHDRVKSVPKFVNATTNPTYTPERTARCPTTLSIHLKCRKWGNFDAKMQLVNYVRAFGTLREALELRTCSVGSLSFEWSKKWPFWDFNVRFTSLESSGNMKNEVLHLFEFWLFAILVTVSRGLFSDVPYASYMYLLAYSGS